MMNLNLLIEIIAIANAIVKGSIKKSGNGTPAPQVTAALLQILQNASQAVHRFGKCWIGGQRLLIGNDGPFKMTFCHQIESSVVVIFGLLAGVRVRHAEKVQAETGF